MNQSYSPRWGIRDRTFKDNGDLRDERRKSEEEKENILKDILLGKRVVSHPALPFEVEEEAKSNKEHKGECGIVTILPV